ncbi:unnamed protein product [Arabidopsis lyrata]|uniref:KIB1-4 beta-propeller domain-containing protein n=1 Tax=Arabidopsis lyrata subsp. lyrata TaxID=81972 RepID=D7KJI3_ARALL|nr:hypothetical protein ARALYDRAFT_337411 [Arabidopsis lyrata subsp. lyrata]CAH8255428.1 unnamed protein product [Arabidopsis lyrata]
MIIDKFITKFNTSRQSVPKNQIPLLILFPEEEDDDDNNNNKDNKEKNFSCTLFNPEEKHKLYKTQDLGVEFAKSVCMATYGSWLLMRDPRLYPLYNMYIVNLFTHERIDLPPVELLWKDYEIRVASHERTWYRENQRLSSCLGIRDWCVVYIKKGDTFWNQIPQTSDCYHMVYKDHKLYFLSYIMGIFKIFDFSGETPQQTFHSCVRVELFQIRRQLVVTQLVVTVTGNVLKVEKWYRARDRSLSFRVFKVYSSGFLKKPEQIYSLGDEFMLLDQGITVLANNSDGFIRNSIYFSTSHGKNTNDIFIFNLETQEMERLLHTLFDSSPIPFSRVQWFLPSFTHI